MESRESSWPKLIVAVLTAVCVWQHFRINELQDSRYSMQSELDDMKGVIVALSEVLIDPDIELESDE